MRAVPPRVRLCAAHAAVQMRRRHARPRAGFRMEERLAERIARVACSNNKEFVLEALTQGVRADGRGCDDCRPCLVRPAAHGSGCQVEVQCGRTRVLASVSSCIVEPYPDKPNKGIVTFGVKLDWCATVWPACL